MDVDDILTHMHDDSSAIQLKGIADKIDTLTFKWRGAYADDHDLDLNNEEAVFHHLARKREELEAEEATDGWEGRTTKERPDIKRDPISNRPIMRFNWPESNDSGESRDAEGDSGDEGVHASADGV